MFCKNCPFRSKESQDLITKIRVKRFIPTEEELTKNPSKFMIPLSCHMNPNDYICQGYIKPDNIVR